MNIDIDEAWQLWEDKFMAITKQKEFCPEQKVVLAEAGSMGAWIRCRCTPILKLGAQEGRG